MNTHRKKTAHLRQIALLLSLMFSMEYAFAWTKEYTQDFNMGDNDSRNTAREWAVDQIKIKAAQEAGTYIQGTTKLAGNELQETITQISTSIVHITVNSDTITTGADGKPVLRVSATANVDESIMTQRINELRHNEEKTREIQQLAHENHNLRLELEKLVANRAAAPNPSIASAIQIEERRIIAALNSNIAATRQSFAPVVSQVDQAIRNAAAKRDQELKEQENEKKLALAELESYRANSALRKRDLVFESSISDLVLNSDNAYYTGNLNIIISVPEVPNFSPDIFPSGIDEEEKTKDHYYGLFAEIGQRTIAYIPIPINQPITNCTVNFTLPADFLNQQSGFKIRVASHDYYKNYQTRLLNDFKGKLSLLSNSGRRYDFSSSRFYLRSTMLDILAMSGLEISYLVGGDNPLNKGNRSETSPFDFRFIPLPYNPDELIAKDISIQPFYYRQPFTDGFRQNFKILRNQCYVSLVGLPEATESRINNGKAYFLQKYRWLPQ